MDEFSGSVTCDEAFRKSRSQETHQQNSAGNLQCLFYATGTSDASESVVRSNRPANEWIASLRNHQSTLSVINSSTSLPNVRYYHDPELFGATPKSASKLREMVESIHELRQRRHQQPNSADGRKRMRQLAQQTSTKIRSLAARESSASAERWRYIQSALERRKRDLIENRERFIRKPLETVFECRKSILKRSCSTPDRPESAYWARQWLTHAKKSVRFDLIEDECDEFKLPALQTLEELSPLIESGSSWAERQVAKVRQRRLWSRMKNVKKDENKRKRFVRTESLLVNLSAESDQDDEEEVERPAKHPARSVTWTVEVENRGQETLANTENDESRPVYAGWDRFPRGTARRISERRDLLEQRRLIVKSPRETSASNLLARRRQFSEAMRRHLAEVRRRKASRRPDAPRDVTGGEEASEEAGETIERRVMAKLMLLRSFPLVKNSVQLAHRKKRQLLGAAD